MAVKIKFDKEHNVIQPTFVLCTKSGERFGVIHVNNLHIKDQFNSWFEFTCTADKSYNGEENSLWDDINDFKVVYCPEWEKHFEIAVEVNEENSIVKNITGRSLCEAELSQVNLYGIQINTEDDIAREDYVPTVLYNPTKPEASMLNRILEKAPGFRIAHVDASIASIQRTFAFDGKSIYDSMMEISEEINCLFVFDTGTDDNGNITRSISAYDIEANCHRCNYRGEFNGECPECGSTNATYGYGKDTNVFVSTENLAEGIVYSVNTDAVKNCFKLEAGDDLMTATVINCNPNGSGYLWYLSPKTRKDMSNLLQTKLEAYDEEYDFYYKDYIARLDAGMISAYNALVTKYRLFRPELPYIPGEVKGYPKLMNAYYDTIDFQNYLTDELMPSVDISGSSAKEQAAKITSAALSPVAVKDIQSISETSASNAVLGMAKVIVDNRFQVKVKSGTLSGTAWTGVFTVTRYADDTDTAESSQVTVSINDDYETYVRQMLDRALHRDSDEKTAIEQLFKLPLAEFTREIRKYCKSRLESFSESCRACLDLMIEQGISAGESWVGTDLYDKLYVPYYEKYLALQEEIKLRENEITVIVGKYDEGGGLIADGMQSRIISENRKVQKALDFTAYLGDELWKEFTAYRREDTYRNENYISDGLTNAQMFDRALEFIREATKEIIKSATQQHRISSTMRNLLVMKEFEPLLDGFGTGNWIRVMVDGALYVLRLTAYEIDFDDLDNLTVEFSDVRYNTDGVSKSEYVIERAASMATTYNTVKRQAGEAEKNTRILNSISQEGLTLTQTRIIDKAENQNISWDKTGFLCREYDETSDTYDRQQVKIINKGIYLTDDNWRTSRAAIGNFLYYSRKTGKVEEAYGVIADTIVSDIILTEELAIYNENNSVSIDKNGFTMITNAPDVYGAKNTFTIKRMYYDAQGVPAYENIFEILNDGNVHVRGALDAITGEIAGWKIQPNYFWSGSGSNYVALASSGGTALWAGSENAASAPFSVSNTGVLKAREVIVGGRPISGTGNADYVTFATTGEYAIQAGNEEGVNAAFYLRMNGYMKHSYGEIAGWNVEADKVRRGSGLNTVGLPGYGEYAMYAGNSVASYASFRLKTDGTLAATRVERLSEDRTRVDVIDLRSELWKMETGYERAPYQMTAERTGTMVKLTLKTPGGDLTAEFDVADVTP